jgi:hypothetical protein
MASGMDQGSQGSARGGRCQVCGGSGGGVIPCTACNGTGGGAHTSPQWLAGWRDDGETVEVERSLLVSGLGPVDEETLLAAALGSEDPGAKCYVCDGFDISAGEDHLVYHYDMTGQCQGRHAHVAWDPASGRIDDVASPAMKLLDAVLDPSFSPPNDARVADGTPDFAAYVHPEIFQVLPVVSIALWTAGASGQGVRAAMDWLAADQLGQMTNYCRQLAAQLGRGDLPLIRSADSLLAGPKDQTGAVVQKAWRALAPVEEAIRAAGAGAARLDIASWLNGSMTLAVSVPSGSVVHTGVALAMLDAAGQLCRQGGTLPAPTVIWNRAPAPRSHPGVGERPCLVLGDDSFGAWTSTSSPWDAFDWVLGPEVGPRALGALATRLGQSPLGAPSPDQALLVTGWGPNVRTLTRSGPL